MGTLYGARIFILEQKKGALLYELLKFVLHHPRKKKISSILPNFYANSPHSSPTCVQFPHISSNTSSKLALFMN
jgi:hypothetical protein